ncbi:DNA-binding protein [Streptomyces ambofaciens]|uniref:DNA-binding protein n=1 Tax=Streptomyces ambofaciens TaxID=1889 RepID=A0ABM6B515_STRAM|nr:DUF397 domain-containing protein [Streptomyces ambofaciens]ANB09296.1 DNA-binding protein [Streptomyces ambofaciens]
MSSGNALEWFKSSYSGSEGGQCLEVAYEPATIHIRDSKADAPTAPRITVAPQAWAAFLAW